MNDLEMGRPDTRIAPRKRRGRLSKRAELLTIVVEMLLISSVAYAADGLTGQGHYMALGAMGIAIYVSSQHFKVLRAEIRSLRAQIRRSDGASRRSSQPSNWPAYHGEHSRSAR
jgi:hypothetical protein